MLSPRISMLGADEAAATAEEVGVPTQLAELSIFRVLLHRPKTAKAVNDLLLSMLFGGALDDRLRELVIMRLGWATGSNYEWTQHWAIAQEAFGCSAEDLLALRDWESADIFGDAERAVLRATDETLTSGTASAETIATCRELLGSDDVVVELVIAIGAWRAISQIARSLDIPLEEGVASWPPDGRVGPGVSPLTQP
ncbi:MAG: carboxymuconolactone decarboxylase family protein [Hyphomicrobiales bacterium]|nr:carboxymuconolactone decarboxylase family protein [Hyphomicrobiales bacterium]